MSEHKTSLERLPEETRSKLRSTLILTSLPQIVSELMQNALDANASHIDIGIDYKEWMCWVRDNGEGINKDGLERLGEGSRYYTSKEHTLGLTNSASTFGFRGEALASAVEISCLEICSRTAKSRNTWSLIMKGRKQLYLGSAVRWNRDSPGTTVCVRDAFYNLPVRRLSHPSSQRTWDLVRQELETYALIFHHVSFTLEDTSRSTENSNHKDRIVRIPKTASTRDSFQHLFGRAMTENIEEVNFISDSIRITGFISLAGATSKAYQFLYLNRHPVSINDFARIIDSEFASSSFAANALDEEARNDLPRATTRRSPRKNEKKPVFVLNISIAPEEVDNCLEPSKSSIQLSNQTDVVSCLRSVIRTFLAKHGFVRQNKDFCERSNSSSPVKGRKSDYSHIDDSGYAEEVLVAETEAQLFEGEESPPEFPLAEIYTSTDTPSEEIVWQDATTGERFVVDRRTGHSFPQANFQVLESDLPSGVNCRVQRRTLWKQPTSQVVSSSILDSDQSVVSEWLERALQGNQAYATVERKIRSVKLPSALDRSSSMRNQCQQRENEWHECQRPQEISSFQGFQRNPFVSLAVADCGLTKDDLRRFKVIDQVDRKFIACRIPTRSSHPQGVPAYHLHSRSEDVLILIDQHAADERVRVERFLKELCIGFLNSQYREDGEWVQGVRIKELSPPRPVLLTEHEALTVIRSQKIRESLRKWGVQIVFAPNNVPVSDGMSEPGSSGYTQVLVSTIPEVVGEKLLQRDELRDFIQGFLGQIQSGELPSDPHLDLPPDPERGEFGWLKAVRYCPRNLLELVNSKACRGAVMFNDSLTVEQCERLIQQLSETAFPFQCAHGRPSLVPLVDIRALHSTSSIRPISVNNWVHLETMDEIQ